MKKNIAIKLVAIFAICSNSCFAQGLYIKNAILEQETQKILNSVNSFYKKNKITKIEFQTKCKEYYKIETLGELGYEHTYTTLLYTEVSYPSKWAGYDCIYYLKFFPSSQGFWNFNYGMSTETDFQYEGSLLYYSNKLFIRNETFCDDVACDTKIYQLGKIIYTKTEQH